MRYSQLGKSLSHGRLLLLCAFSLSLVSVCSLPTGSEPGLTIVIEGSAARTLAPDFDMNTSLYAISGSGPRGATFSTTTTGNSVTVPSLASGQWAVAVDGLNSAGIFILHGSGTAKVTGGNNTSTLTVTVFPIAGPGSLSLTVNWPATSVTTPSIKAQLVPSTGSATNLDFSTPTNGSSSYNGSGIMNGYYTLVVQLYDGTALVAGAVEVAEIVQGQTTSGSYTFASVNIPGSPAVNITPSLVDPIAVTLTGQQAAVGAGTAVTLNASVPADAGNVTCVWYVNGVARGFGASYTLNDLASALAPGTYRIDVTAFTSDGLRAGAASTLMSVS